MLRSVCHYLRSRYSHYRCGIDTADIQHVRADLRFRLAIVEYAYFGRSGRRVARCIEELKVLLGDKAVSRYLRTLDPDLCTQFVERFQGFQRDAQRDANSRRLTGAPPDGKAAGHREPAQVTGEGKLAANVVPITRAARHADEPTQELSLVDDPQSSRETT